MYNVYNLEPKFKFFLIAENISEVSIRNYLSDVRHFFGWFFRKINVSLDQPLGPIIQTVSQRHIAEYAEYSVKSTLPTSTINRRLSALRKFFSFCLSNKLIETNPLEKVKNISQVKKSEPAKKLQGLHKEVNERVVHFSFINFIQTKHILNKALLSLELIIILLVFYKVWNRNPVVKIVSAQSTSVRFLSFSGILKSKLGNPIVDKTDVTFNLYDSPEQGKELFSAKCVGENYAITPNTDGKFTTIVGKDCGSSGIPASLFIDKPNIYLGITVGSDAELAPRELIPNVGYSLNAFQLQGLNRGTTSLSIPYINQEGNLLIASTHAGIRSTYTNADFSITSAESILVQSAGKGDIVLQATDSGSIKLRTEGGDSDYYTKLIVTNGGNVGIGTLFPSNKLEVAGNIYAQSGQIRLGNFSSSPLPAGLGSLYYDTTSRKPFYWDGINWVDFTSNSSAADLKVVGKVGIGTSNPSFKLDLITSDPTKPAAAINNSSDSSTASGLQIKLGYTGNGTTSNNYLTFLDGNEKIKGRVQSNGSGGISYNTSGSDFAEYFVKSNESYEAGDVIAIDNNNSYVRKSIKPYDSQLIGVFSSRAGFVGGEPGNDKIIVALLGQVPVKISPASQAIKRGDFLTSSSYPGYAARLEKAGVTIGKALEDWDPHKPSKTILTLVNVNWFDPTVYITNSGDVQIKTDSDQSSTYLYVGNFGDIENNSIRFKVETTSGEIINKIVAAKDGIYGRIKTGYLKAEDASIKNLSSLLTTSYYLLATNLTVREKLVSPVVETDQLSVKEINPQDQNIVVNLVGSTENRLLNTDKGPLARLIIKGLEGKTVASIDAGGNASFSGQIAAESLQIAKNATVAGTLTANEIQANEASLSGKLIAKEIEADNISQLENKIASLSNSSTNENTKNNETMKQFNNTINEIQKLLAEIKNQPLSDAKYYQKLDQTSNLKPLTDLTVTGNSNLYNLSVTGSTTVGSLLIENNSILSLAWDLKLSSLGTIKLFDDAVVIAKDGTITTRGVLIAQGGIQTNKIEIRNSLDSEVASIDTSGSARFNNVAMKQLNITDKYLNTSLIASAENLEKNGISAPAIETQVESAGVGYIPEGSPEVLIYNNTIKDDSLIYLTSTNSSPSESLTVVKKESCSPGSTDSSICKPYFKVGLDNTVPTPVHFNWLIIN